MNPPDPTPVAPIPVNRNPVPAPLIRRWGALVYEILLITAVLLIAGFAVLPLVGALPAGGHRVAALQVVPAASRAFLSLYDFAVLGLYCVFFWTRDRRTLAMKTWRLTLQTLDGEPLDARAAVKRYLAGWIGPAVGLVAYAALGRWGLLAGFLNYYWAWVDPRRQFLHDRLAGTQIVREP